jgi:hypothetical protein
MTEPQEISAKDIGVGARIARPAIWLVAGVVSFIAIAGLWTPAARAQTRRPIRLPQAHQRYLPWLSWPGGIRTAGDARAAPNGAEAASWAACWQRQCVSATPTSRRFRTKGRGESQLRQLPRISGNAKDENKADEIASERCRPNDRPLHALSPRAAQQDRSVAHNATCYNCHKPLHLSEGRPNRNWWRLNLPYACGSCHLELGRTRPRCTAENCRTAIQRRLLGLPHHHDVQNPSLDTTRLLITRTAAVARSH